MNRLPLKNCPHLIFGSKASLIIYNELKSNRYNWAIFAKTFNKFCKHLNQLDKIEDRESRVFFKNLLLDSTKNRMENLFNDNILPKNLLSLALNSVKVIYRKQNL